METVRSVRGGGFTRGPIGHSFFYGAIDFFLGSMPQLNEHSACSLLALHATFSQAISPPTQLPREDADVTRCA